MSRLQLPFKASRKVPPISLRLLLTLPFVVQVGGVVGAVGYLSYRHGQQTIETMAHALMDQVGQRVTQELNSYLYSAHRFNQAQVAAIAAQAISPQDLDHLHRYLILQHRQENDLTTLLFGTPQGDFRISHRVTPADYGVNTRLQPEEIPIEATVSEGGNPSTNHLYGVDGAGQMGRYLETIDNMDVRDRPWYRQAIATGKPGWVGPYQLGSTNLLTLNAHTPVYDEGGELLGVFAANITLNQLGDFLANLTVGQSGEVIILERNGLVVATSTGEGPYAITSSPNANSRTPPGQLGFERLQPTDLANPTIQRAYTALRQRFPDLDNLRSPQAIHVEGSGMHSFITVVPYSDAYGLDWLVMTVMPKADFTAAIQQNLRKTVGLCLLALGGAIASGVLLSTWVTRQITRLTQASAALAAGDLTQQVPTTSPIVETKTLALAFNQMAVQLRQLFQHQVAAEAARQSEARFQRLAAAVPGMIYTYTLRADGTTGFDYVSWASQSILELTPEQLLADAETAMAQIHPDDRSTHAAAVARSATTLEPFSLAFRNITPSGQLKWLEATSQPLRYDDGSVTWYGLLLDVSDRAQFEADLQFNAQKLAASEARFQKMATILPGLLYISLQKSDGSTEFIYGSPTATELLEVELDAAIADSSVVFNLFHPDDWAGFVATRNHSVATMQPFRHEWRVITPSGKTKWLQISARHEQLPNQDILWFGVVLDISDRKRAELELQRQNDLRETIYNESTDALFLVDPNTLLITDCNQRTVELFEVENKAVLIGIEGHTLQRHPFTAAEMAAIAADMKQNGVWSREVEYVTAKGNVFWGNLAAKVVQIGDQTIHLVRVTDIGDRKKVEAALQQANQQLEARLDDLRQRNQDMLLLGRLNDCLQVCLTLDEAYAALPDLLQPLFPDCAGGLFTIATPGSQVKARATWGQPLRSETEFSLADCWALHLKRGYWLPSDQAQQHCQHVILESRASGAVTLCVPMLAQGEISGLLYLSAATPAMLPTAKRQLAHTVAEQMALAIANLHLRETLQEQSIRDPLTGLYNRRYLEEALQQAIASAQRHQHSIGVIMLDADHFKSFNDTYGHDLGDRVLQAIAQVLAAGIRQSDLACRYGGEEFTLVLPQSSLAETAARAETLRQQIHQLVLSHGEQPVTAITVSFGVACFPEHGLTGSELLQRADQALYQAKAAGRDQVVCA